MTYFQYQRLINVDWERVQAFLQNGIISVLDALTHIYNNIDVSLSGTLSNTWIPLVVAFQRLRFGIG